MRNLQHDACTIARLVARLGTSVFHVFQYTQCLIHQLVTLPSVYVHYHAHTAYIVFIMSLIKSVLLTFCHIILT